MGILANPFPRVAICVGELASKDDPFIREMDITRHLHDGVTLEQARSLMSSILSREVIDYTLQDGILGDIIEIIVDSDKMELLKRKLPSEERI